MTKSELNLLIEEIKKIEMKEMKEITFSSNTGGCPVYNERLKEDMIECDENYQYDTSQNGSAYSGWIKLACNKTKFVDYRGDSIYVSKSGFVFSNNYRPGTPASFDRTILDTPDIRINLEYFDINEFIEIKSNYDEFVKKHKENK